MDKYKLTGNRYIPSDHEELTVLEIIHKLTNYSNALTDELKNKVTQGENFTGSWHGVDKPTQIEEGIQGVVDKNVEDIKSLKSEVSKIENFYVDVTKYGIDKTGVNDCTSIFNTLCSKYKNLYFPTGKYKGTFIIPSNTKIQGDKPYFEGNNLKGGTVFLNRLEVTSSKGIEIKSIGVECENDGVKITKNSSDILVKECIFNVALHGVLVEPFGGNTENITVENCTTHGGVHGFISKGYDVRFYNCTAYNPGANGFGLISDNMLGVDMLCNCTHNKIVNCKVDGKNITGNGLNFYARDYFSSDTTQVKNEFHLIDNFTVTNCKSGLTIGEGGISDIIKKVIAIKGVTFNKIIIVNNTAAIGFNNCDNIIITGGWSDGYIGTQKATNIFINNVSKIANQLDDFIINDNKTAPSFDNCLNGRIVFRNTSPTNVFNFNSMEVGKRIFVTIDDNGATTIVPSAQIDAPKNLTGKGSRAVYYCGRDWKWHEESRTEV